MKIVLCPSFIFKKMEWYNSPAEKESSERKREKVSSSGNKILLEEYAPASAVLLLVLSKHKKL